MKRCGSDEIAGGSNDEDDIRGFHQKIEGSKCLQKQFWRQNMNRLKGV